jgi:hypothetical protein
MDGSELASAQFRIVRKRENLLLILVALRIKAEGEETGQSSYTTNRV